jgi:phosphoglycolate phosphatase/putative hydrolase of the HAD superfamily
VTAYRVPATIGAFLFDIDGTLYSHDGYARFQQDVLIRELARIRGQTFEAMAAAVERVRREHAAANDGEKTSLGNAMAALGVDIATSSAWRARLIKPSAYLHADPELRHALVSLATGLKGQPAVLVAVTNNPRSTGEATLEALGVSDLFLHVVGLDDTMKSKPAAEPYLLAASLAGVAPEYCLSIGDRYDVDLAIPLELGMGAILVSGVADVYTLPTYLS